MWFITLLNKMLSFARNNLINSVRHGRTYIILTTAFFRPNTVEDMNFFFTIISKLKQKIDNLNPRSKICQKIESLSIFNRNYNFTPVNKIIISAWKWNSKFPRIDIISTLYFYTIKNPVENIYISTNFIFNWIRSLY